jgi:hypothetical protein
MAIDFDFETSEITSKLKQVEGYLDCEKIIVHNIKKQLEYGNNDENIVLYLTKLSTWLGGKITTNHINTNCTNYRYAAGFIDMLLEMIDWKRWMKSIDE